MPHATHRFFGGADCVRRNVSYVRRSNVLCHGLRFVERVIYLLNVLARPHAHFSSAGDKRDEFGYCSTLKIMTAAISYNLESG